MRHLQNEQVAGLHSTKIPTSSTVGAGGQGSGPTSKMRYTKKGMLTGGGRKSFAPAAEGERPGFGVPWGSDEQLVHSSFPVKKQGY